MSGGNAPLVTIGDLASSEPGAFKIGPFGSSLKKSELIGRGIPVLGIENVLPNHFEMGGKRFISPTKFEELVDYAIRPDDILVTTMGTIGRAAVVPKARLTAIIDSHLFRMRVDARRILPRYLAYALNSSDLARQLAKKSRGAIMDGLNTTILKECALRVPPLRDQELVLSQLDEATQLSRKRRFALAISESLLGARFLEVFGENHALWQRWPTRELSELVVTGDKVCYGVVQPGDFVEGGVRLVRVADLDGIEDDDIDLKRIDASIEARYSAARLKGDELLIACVGSIGRIAAASPYLRGANVARAVARVPLDWMKVDREFMRQYLKQGIVQQFFAREARTVSQPTLNIEQITQTPVIQPPIELQRQFAFFAQQYTPLRRQLREALRQAQHLFQTLLHEAFGAA